MTTISPPHLHEELSHAGGGLTFPQQQEEEHAQSLGEFGDVSVVLVRGEAGESADEGDGDDDRYVHTADQHLGREGIESGGGEDEEEVM